MCVYTYIYMYIATTGLRVVNERVSLAIKICWAGILYESESRIGCLEI